LSKTIYKNVLVLGFSCPQPFYFETAEGGEEKRLFFSLGSLVPHLPSTFQDSRGRRGREKFL